MLEQALYGSDGTDDLRVLTKSPGFVDDWLPLAERLCGGFDERTPDVSCHGCLFARPLDRGHVAVVQVADDGGRPSKLGFRIIALSKDAYLDLGGDPFFIADQFPPDWQARGELPALSWPENVAVPLR